MKKAANNIYDMQGFTKVFRFTLEQTFKSPTYRASFIMLIVMSMLMGPLSLLGANAGLKAAKDTEVMESDEKVPASAIYVVNNSHIEFTEEMMKLDETSFSEVKVVEAEELPQLKADEIGVVLSRKNVDGADSYLIESVTADESDITGHQLEELSDYLIGGFNDARLISAEVSDEQTKMLQAGITNGGVMTEEEYRSSSDKQFSTSQIGSVSLIYCVVVLILASLSGTYVINTVMEEKTSKLVENLLVSVRPMALIMGKILGIMSYVLLTLICAGTGAAISNAVTNMFISDELKHATGGIKLSAIGELGILKLAVLLVCLLLTFLLMSILAGILGSACSKLEDAQSATGSLMMFSFIGYIVGLAVPGLENHTADIAVSLIPVTAPFVAPVFAVTGRISPLIFCISLLIMIVMLIFLFRLCAKVYKKLIVNDSKKLGFLEILKLSREGV